MAKANKDITKKPKKKSKYDITVKLDMTFEEAIKLAVNTPLKNSKVKKK